MGSFAVSNPVEVMFHIRGRSYSQYNFKGRHLSLVKCKLLVTQHVIDFLLFLMLYIYIIDNYVSDNVTHLYLRRNSETPIYQVKNALSITTLYIETEVYKVWLHLHCILYSISALYTIFNICIIYYIQYLYCIL